MFPAYLNGDITSLNDTLKATNETYVPTFTWTAGGTPPTVTNIQAKYSVMAKICFVYIRYQITNLGTPGNSANLKISLPEGIVPILDSLSMVSEYQTDSVVSKTLGVRISSGGFINTIQGIGGNNSGTYIPTGYQGFSAYFMIN